MLLHIALGGALLAGPVCDIVTTFGSPPTADRAVTLAVATGERVAVPVPEYAKRALPDSITEVIAYRFVVLESVGGPRLVSGDSFLVVPWGYDEACRPMLWEGGEWVPSGAESVFRHGEPGRESGGQGVFDVSGWHSPYPYGAFLKYGGTPSPPEDRTEWLSARDYFGLLSVLPPPDPLVSRLERLRRIESAYRAGPPHWAVTFPGDQILRSARRWASFEFAFEPSLGNAYRIPMSSTSNTNMP